MQWFQLSLQLRGSVAPKIATRVLFFGTFAALVSTAYYFELPLAWPAFGSVTTNVVFNFVLGLLLVFRTNTAYERFWEGRKCWGTLVISIRNLSRQIWVNVAEITAGDREEKVVLLKRLGAFAIATKLHLRKESLSSEIENLVTSEQAEILKTVKNPPLEISKWIGEYINRQYQRNCLSLHQMTAMNQLLDNMVEALTGCERILKTPIPVAYAIYLKRLLVIYCCLLPFQLVEKLQWWTGIIVVLIAFVLLGIEEIGNEIENPFGYDENDLPLDEICQTLLDNLEELRMPALEEKAEKTDYTNRLLSNSLESQSNG